MLINGTHATNGTGNTGATGGTSGTGSTTANGSSTSSGTASGISLGGTDFLTLMLAQLQNQDPTSPVDGNEFLTQLAQLSEVQGINQLNTSFTGFTNANQAMQASSLLGQSVLADSSTATLSTAGGTISGAIDVPQTSSQVTLNITNSTGVSVATINLGAQSSGLASFSWNGQESNGSQAPAGTYTLTATVAGTATGTDITTLVNGTVDSVTLGSGTTGMTVNVAGVGNVPFSSVQQISK